MNLGRLVAAVCASSLIGAAGALYVYWADRKQSRRRSWLA